MEKIEPLKKEFMEEAQKRLDDLTKPPGSLGRLEEFARRIVAITEKKMPVFDKKIVFTFAGDHGVVAEGVSAYLKEVTLQMALNIINGGAAINVLARHAGAEVLVVDIGVDYTFEETDGLAIRKVVPGTKNMLKEPAMSRSEAESCVNVGIDLATAYAEKGYSLFGTGDMGIGNTTPSSAIAAVLTGRSVAEVTGKGTGITDASLAHKITVIEESIRLHKPNPADGLDVLAKVGGAEIGGIAGLCLGAAAARVPVVVDGIISTAGALIAYAIEPKTAEYMFAAHKSVEIGQKAMLDRMGLKPILDLDLRLGEGTGGALAMLLIEGGLKIYREMATFSEAGVWDQIQ